MSRRIRQDTVSRLDPEGWVYIYDPLPRRQDYAGEADGPNEFGQRESFQSVMYAKFGYTDAIETTQEALAQGNIEPEDTFNWPWE